ncbi:MAG: ArnT family glycosyltransferase [Halobacteriaceae archaeon]
MTITRLQQIRNPISQNTKYAILLAGIGGLVIWLVSIFLFPYHSLNHDEGVYLQQAALVLEGQLNLWPPVPEAFRPWFFVQSGDRFYPKYTPVPAVMFATGKFLFGSYRIALGIIAASNLFLIYAIGREVFDTTIGLVAGGVAVISPLFIINSAVFLPYAPTALLNWVFALTYFRGIRTQTMTMAILAGGAIGLAFFARPFTAFLFAAPFILASIYQVIRMRFHSDVVEYHLTIAIVGSLGVLIALLYNKLMTGNFLLFPYKAFGPHDGIGFGMHSLLGYQVYYSPELALLANSIVLRLFFSQWIAGGIIGFVILLIGIVTVLSNNTVFKRPAEGMTRINNKFVLFLLFVSIAGGNIYFWGNLNIIGDLMNPDGLITFLGPYYHFDMLLPTAIFTAVGGVWIVRFIHERVVDHIDVNRRISQIGAALVIFSILISGSALAVDDVVRRNQTVTAEYEEAYQPFQSHTLTNAVIFVPTPYGEWLNHPFQALRNSPRYDGAKVYALSKTAPFAVIDAFPHRNYYRFSYRGAWNPFDGDPVQPTLNRIHIASGRTVVTKITIGIPSNTNSISIRLSDRDSVAYYAIGPDTSSATLFLNITRNNAKITGRHVSVVGDDKTISLSGTSQITVEIFVDGGHGSRFSYVIRQPVETNGPFVRTLSPYTELCFDFRRCGGGAAYIPAAIDRADVFINTSIV